MHQPILELMVYQHPAGSLDPGNQAYDPNHAGTPSDR